MTPVIDIVTLAAGTYTAPTTLVDLTRPPSAHNLVIHAASRNSFTVLVAVQARWEFWDESSAYGSFSFPSSWVTATPGVQAVFGMDVPATTALPPSWSVSVVPTVTSAWESPQPPPHRIKILLTAGSFQTAVDNVGYYRFTWY